MKKFIIFLIYKLLFFIFVKERFIDMCLGKRMVYLVVEIVAENSKICMISVCLNA